MNQEERQALTRRNAQMLGSCTHELKNVLKFVDKYGSEVLEYERSKKRQQSEWKKFVIGAVNNGS